MSLENISYETLKLDYVATTRGSLSFPLSVVPELKVSYIHILKYGTLSNTNMIFLLSLHSLNFPCAKSMPKSQGASLFTQTKSYSAPLTKAAKSFMFCQHLIPPVPLAICLPPDNRGRRMAADCWNAPQ